MATGEETALFTWSEAARNDFQTVVESVDARSRYLGGDVAPGPGATQTFRLALANTIAAGWDDNRDKPGWALCLLLGQIGETDLELPTAISFIWENPVTIVRALASSGASSVKQNSDGSLYLDGPGGRLSLSPFRVRLLQSYLEFILICDADGEDADPESLAIDLDAVLRGEPKAADTASKRLARVMYGYRRKHFDDGHATTAFSRVRSFLLEAGDTVGDDTVLDFWRAQRVGSSRPTYASAFDTVRSYVDTLRAAQSRAAARSASDINDPAFQQGDAGPADGDEAAAETVSTFDDIELLRSTPVKFATKETVAKLIAPVVRAGGFGRSLPVATLRLLTFHPIQSALSTELKTGQARVPTAERVRCTEAAPYADLLAEVLETESRMKEWMTMALALVTPASTDPKVTDLRAAGERLLAAKRGKAFGRDTSEIAADFRTATPALVAASASLRGFAGAADSALGQRMADQFSADCAQFSEVFTALYLNTEAHAS